MNLTQQAIQAAIKEKWKEAIEIAKPYPNLYLDIACSLAPFDKVKVAVDELGPERVLFGSAMTEISPDVQLGAVLDSQISLQERQIVLYEGARRVFEL